MKIVKSNFIPDLDPKTKFSKEESEFLETFFQAAANLYGCISLEEAWCVYTELRKQMDVPELSKHHLFSYSELLKKEKHNYQVYSTAELYASKPVLEHTTLILDFLLDLQMPGAKFSAYDAIMQTSDKFLFHVPKNFLTYATLKTSEEEKAILAFLDELEIPEATSSHTPYSAKDIGSLGSLTSLSLHEKEYLNRLLEQGNEADYVILKDRYNCSKAQKLLNRMKLHLHTNSEREAFIIVSQDLLFELNAIGIRLTIDHGDKLAHLLTDLINTTRWYCFRGWTPQELAEPQCSETKTFSSGKTEEEKTEGIAASSLEKRKNLGLRILH